MKNEQSMSKNERYQMLTRKVSAVLEALDLDDFHVVYEGFTGSFSNAVVRNPTMDEMMILTLVAKRLGLKSEMSRCEEGWLVRMWEPITND